MSDYTGAPCLEPGAWFDYIADFPDNTIGDFHAAQLCEGCEFATVCLATALDEEGTTPARGRAGVRGGLTPRLRARLAAGGKDARALNPLICPKGHRRHNSNTTFKSGYLECLECRSERSKNSPRVTCPDCGTEMMSTSLNMHRRRFHQDEEKAA